MEKPQSKIGLNDQKPYLKSKSLQLYMKMYIKTVFEDVVFIEQLRYTHQIKALEIIYNLYGKTPI